MRNSKTMFRLSAALLASGLFAAGSAQGAFQLLQFEPTPVSPGLAEFSWTGPGGNYTTGNGSHGNGDGGLLVANQIPGGLQVDTPLVVPGVAGSTIDASGTHFYDVTMSFSSDAATGAGATTLADAGAYALLNPALNLAVQTLTNGSFTMTATDGTTVLLTGNFSGDSFSFPLGSTSAGFQAGTVTYTGGSIYTALVGSGGLVSGSASISMTSLAGPIVANYTGPGTGFLQQASATINPFDANATGVFDVASIPEPASMSILAIGGIMGLRRRR